MSRRAGTTDEASTIEFVAPNDAAFGASTSADFIGIDGHDPGEFGDADAPRAAWLGALAGVVVAALIVGGVIAAAPWSDGPDAAPAVTIAPSGSTVPPASPARTVGDTTPVDALAGVAFEPVGWVIDDPTGGLQPSAGFSNPGGGSLGPGSEWLDVWTTPGDVRTGGRRLALSTLDVEEAQFQLVLDGVRFELAGGPALLSTATEEAFMLRFIGTDGTPFEMAGAGFTLDEIVRIANTVTRPYTIDFGDLQDSGGPFEAMQRTISGSVPYGGFNFTLFGSTEAFTSYYDPATLGSVTVQRGPVWSPDAMVIASLLLDTPPEVERSGGDGSVTIEIAAGQPRTLTIGSFTDGSGQSLVRWAEDGQQVMLIGTNASVDDLIDMASRTRLATPAEWQDLVIDSRDGVALTDNEGSRTFTHLADGTLSDGQRWEADSNGSLFFVSTGSYGSAFPVPDGPMPYLRTYSTASATFVVAASAWPGTAVTLRVTVQDQPSVDRPLVRLGDTPTFMAVHGFSELGPFTAELLDAAGAVVAAIEGG